MTDVKIGEKTASMYVDIGLYWSEEDNAWLQGNRFIKLCPDGTIEANWYDCSYEEREAIKTMNKEHPNRSIDLKSWKLACEVEE